MMRGEVSMDLTFFQGETLEEDLRRRDFNINAIAVSLRDETCHAIEGAFDDIEKKLIRSVSPHSIDQDPLRMLRAIRYLCTLEGFSIDIRLEQEISSKKDLIQHLPGERVKMELDRILLSPHPYLGIKSLYELGLLLVLMPELTGLENLGQNKHHHLNVLPHVLLMIEKIGWTEEWLTQNGKPVSMTLEGRLALYYAALFHDLGKQDTYSQDEKGRVHFYHHESLSCQRAAAIMERLRFSNSMKNRIISLIKHHMRILNLSSETGESALKRLVNQMGENTPLLILHTLADKEASRGILSIQIDEIVEGHCLRLLQLFEQKEIVHPPPLISGHDVMAMGYPSGPKVGEILNFIREKQIEGEIKTSEEALYALKERFKI
jgi:tRNA nucleotidyltransferase/poly(A) polymerase